MITYYLYLISKELIKIGYKRPGIFQISFYPYYLLGVFIAGFIHLLPQEF
jgi:hypothetical protein